MTLVGHETCRVIMAGHVTLIETLGDRVIWMIQGVIGIVILAEGDQAVAGVRVVTVVGGEMMHQETGLKVCNFKNC